MEREDLFANKADLECGKQRQVARKQVSRQEKAVTIERHASMSMAQGPEKEG